MIDLSAQLMAAYGWVIKQYLGIGDETIDPALQQRLDDAPPLSSVELSSGVATVKPAPDNERYFQHQRVPGILGEAATGTVSALYHSTLHPFRMDYQDRDVEFLLNETYFGRLITEGPAGPIVDLSHHEGLDTLPGFYTHGIKAFLRREADGSCGRYLLDRLEISGHPVTRGHPSWDLAKIHLIAGMDNDTLFTDHAVGHLNNDFVEAAMRRTLPEDNPLRRFLAPHFDITIPLDQLIMDLLYQHTNPGNPFGFPVRSLYALISKGLQDDHARGLCPVFADTHYDRAMVDSYRVVLDHVTEFVDKNLRVDTPAFAQIRAFTEDVRASIPYFPRGDELTLDAVKLLCARTLHDATLVSSAEHVVTRDAIGYFKSIFRVRRPFVPDAAFRVDELFRPIDTFQRIVFRNVFSGDHPASLLGDVEYDPALGLNQSPFKSRLRELAQRHPTVFPLDRISASIDI